MFIKSYSSSLRCSAMALAVCGAPLTPVMAQQTDQTTQAAQPPAPPKEYPATEGQSVMDELDDTPRLPDPTPGQTRTLNDLIREYREKCGANGSRERLLMGLDRAIGQETDANRREIRKGQRDRVAAGAEAEACPPEPPAPKTAGQVSPNASARTEARADIDLQLDEIDRYLKIGDRREARRLIDGFKAHQLINFSYLDSEQQARLESAEIDAFSGDFADAVFRKAVEDASAEDARARRRDAFFNVFFNYPKLPQTGIGVIRLGAPGAAPEEDAGRTARNVNGLGISAGFNAIKLGGGLDLSFEARYSEAKGSTDFTTPASTASARADTGIVLGRLSNGSSGFIAGFGGSGSARVKAQTYGLGAEVGLSAAEIYAEASGFRVVVGVDYEHAERDHDLSFGSSGTSGGSTFFFEQDRQQDLDEDYLGFYGGLDVDIPFSGETDGGLRFGGRIRLGPYHRDTHFEGIERDTANFGAPSNRDLRLDFSEDDGGWGGFIKAEAGLTYDLNDSISISLDGGFRYRSEIGQIVNPSSGDAVFFGGETTHLETEKSEVWEVLFGTKFRF